MGIAVFVIIGFALGACASAPREAQPSSAGPRFPSPAEIGIMMANDSLPRPVRFDRGPSYPVEQRNNGVTGQLVAAFVIDTSGRAEYRSITIVEAAPHPDFHRSVCEFLRSARFIPARIGGVAQRTLVFMPFWFSLSTAPPLGPPPNVKQHQARALAMPREELVAELERRPHC